MKLIDKSALVAEIKRRMDENSGKQTLPQYFGMIEEDLNILSFIDTLEVKEIGVDLGDPKGDKSARHIIDTKTLEVKEVDLMIHTIIAECCDWLAMNTNLSHNEIEDCRNLMLTVKEEQFKAQKGE